MSAYRRILVAVDGSPAGAKGLEEAIRLAKAHRASLFILHVVNRFNAYDRMEGVTSATAVLRLLREDGGRILAKAQAQAEREGVQAASVLREVTGGPAADPILREAKKLRPDLIVLGTHGRRGLRRIVMGSDAEQVVRASPVPVLLLRAGT